jgi:hypothetical protein
MPLLKVEDDNEGLRKVVTEDDARQAAAAILSLYGQGQVSPGPWTPGRSR